MKTYLTDIYNKILAAYESCYYIVLCTKTAKVMISLPCYWHPDELYQE